MSSREVPMSSAFAGDVISRSVNRLNDRLSKHEPSPLLCSQPRSTAGGDGQQQQLRTSQVPLPVLVDQRQLAISDEEELCNDHVHPPLLRNQIHTAVGGGARQQQLRTSHEVPPTLVDQRILGVVLRGRVKGTVHQEPPAAVLEDQSRTEAINNNYGTRNVEHDVTRRTTGYISSSDEEDAPTGSRTSLNSLSLMASLEAMKAHATATIGPTPPIGSAVQAEQLRAMRINMMRDTFANSCKSYTGPSAEWLLRRSAQDAFADYVEKTLDDSGPVAMAAFYRHAFETIRKIAMAAARLALFCADKYREFGEIREAAEFWPRFRQFFADMPLQERAAVLIRAHEWMNKYMPIHPSEVKKLITSATPERAFVREPITMSTSMTSSCQFLRTIQVELGAADAVSVTKSPLWAYISHWLNLYSQSVGGGLSPLQKMTITSADLTYLFNRPDAKTNNVKVAQSWHLCLMLLSGMRPGSMQEDPMKNCVNRAMNNRKRRSNGGDEEETPEMLQAIIAQRKWEDKAFFLEGELKTADALAERKRLRCTVEAPRGPASVAAGATDEQQQHHDNAAAAPFALEQRNDDGNGAGDDGAAPDPAPDTQQRPDQNHDDLMFAGLRIGDVKIYRLRARDGDSERIVRHQAVVTVRRSKTGGYVPFAPYECGYTWPVSIGTNDSQSGSNGGNVEFFMPNAATGFLLQSILRGHVDARCILDDETSFWSKHPDAGHKVLISTSIDSRSPLMAASLFALPVTAEFARGYGINLQSLVHQLECKAYHAGRNPEDIEIEIGNYKPLLETFCESFAIPKAGFAQTIITDYALRLLPHQVLTESMIEDALTTSPQWNSTRQAMVYARMVRAELRRTAESMVGMSASDWLGSREECSFRSRLRNVGYKPLDYDQARTKWRAVQAARLSEGHATEKVPDSSALKRMRDKANVKMFNETEPIVNGDVDVKNLSLDIRATVKSVIELRNNVKPDSGYRIHFC